MIINKGKIYCVTPLKDGSCLYNFVYTYKDKEGNFVDKIYHIKGSSSIDLTFDENRFSHLIGFYYDKKEKKYIVC